MPWGRKWQPTPVFLPGKFRGQQSLAGCIPWGPRVGQDWGITCVSRISRCRLVGDRRLLRVGYWLAVLVFYETHAEGSSQLEGQMLKDNTGNAVNRKHALKRWWSTRNHERGRERALVGNAAEVTWGMKGSWRAASVRSCGL